MKGNVEARHIENEFKTILGANVWRWTAKKVGENKFSVRFPITEMIKSWGHFRPLGMRTIDAQICIDPWNAAVGAKAEFQ